MSQEEIFPVETRTNAVPKTESRRPLRGITKTRPTFRRQRNTTSSSRKEEEKKSNVNEARFMAALDRAFEKMQSIDQQKLDPSVFDKAPADALKHVLQQDIETCSQRDQIATMVFTEMDTFLVEIVRERGFDADGFQVLLRQKNAYGAKLNELFNNTHVEAFTGLPNLDTGEVQDAETRTKIIEATLVEQRHYTALYEGAWNNIYAYLSQVTGIEDLAPTYDSRENVFADTLIDHIKEDTAEDVPDTMDINFNVNLWGMAKTSASYCAGNTVDSFIEQRKANRSLQNHQANLTGKLFGRMGVNTFKRVFNFLFTTSTDEIMDIPEYQYMNQTVRAYYEAKYEGVHFLKQDMQEGERVLRHLALNRTLFDSNGTLLSGEKTQALATLSGEMKKWAESRNYQSFTGKLAGRIEFLNFPTQYYDALSSISPTTTSSTTPVTTSSNSSSTTASNTPKRNIPSDSFFKKYFEIMSLQAHLMFLNDLDYLEDMYITSVYGGLDLNLDLKEISDKPTTRPITRAQLNFKEREWMKVEMFQKAELYNKHLQADNVFFRNELDILLFESFKFANEFNTPDLKKTLIAPLFFYFKTSKLKPPANVDAPMDGISNPILELVARLTKLDTLANDGKEPDKDKVQDHVQEYNVVQALLWRLLYNRKKFSLLAGTIESLDKAYKNSYGYVSFITSFRPGRIVPKTTSFGFLEDDDYKNYLICVGYLLKRNLRFGQTPQQANEYYKIIKETELAKEWQKDKAFSIYGGAGSEPHKELTLEYARLEHYINPELLFSCNDIERLEIIPTSANYSTSSEEERAKIIDKVRQNEFIYNSEQRILLKLGIHHMTKELNSNLKTVWMDLIKDKAVNLNNRNWYDWVALLTSGVSILFPSMWPTVLVAGAVTYFGALTGLKRFSGTLVNLLVHRDGGQWLETYSTNEDYYQVNLDPNNVNALTSKMDDLVNNTGKILYTEISELSGKSSSESSSEPPSESSGKSSSESVNQTTKEKESKKKRPKKNVIPPVKIRAANFNIMLSNVFFLRDIYGMDITLNGKKQQILPSELFSGEPSPFSKFMDHIHLYLDHYKKGDINQAKALPESKISWTMIMLLFASVGTAYGVYLLYNPESQPRLFKEFSEYIRDLGISKAIASRGNNIISAGPIGTISTRLKEVFDSWWSSTPTPENKPPPNNEKSNMKPSYEKLQWWSNMYYAKETAKTSSDPKVSDQEACTIIKEELKECIDAGKATEKNQDMFDQCIQLFKYQTELATKLGVKTDNMSEKFSAAISAPEDERLSKMQTFASMARSKNKAIQKAIDAIPSTPKPPPDNKLPQALQPRSGTRTFTSSTFRMFEKLFDFVTSDLGLFYRLQMIGSDITSRAITVTTDALKLAIEQIEPIHTIMTFANKLEEGYGNFSNTIKNTETFQKIRNTLVNIIDNVKKPGVEHGPLTNAESLMQLFLKNVQNPTANEIVMYGKLVKIALTGNVDPLIIVVSYLDRRIEAKDDQDKILESQDSLRAEVYPTWHEKIQPIRTGLIKMELAILDASDAAPEFISGGYDKISNTFKTLYGQIDEAQKEMGLEAASAALRLHRAQNNAFYIEQTGALLKDELSNISYQDLIKLFETQTNQNIKIQKMFVLLKSTGQKRDNINRNLATSRLEVQGALRLQKEELAKMKAVDEEKIKSIQTSISLLQNNLNNVNKTIKNTRNDLERVKEDQRRAIKSISDLSQQVNIPSTTAPIPNNVNSITEILKKEQTKLTVINNDEKKMLTTISNLGNERNGIQRQINEYMTTIGNLNAEIGGLIELMDKNISVTSATEGSTHTIASLEKELKKTQEDITTLESKLTEAYGEAEIWKHPLFESSLNILTDVYQKKLEALKTETNPTKKFIADHVTNLFEQIRKEDTTASLFLRSKLNFEFRLFTLSQQGRLLKRTKDTDVFLICTALQNLIMDDDGIAPLIKYIYTFNFPLSQYIVNMTRDIIESAIDRLVQAAGNGKISSVIRGVSKVGALAVKGTAVTYNAWSDLKKWTKITDFKNAWHQLATVKNVLRILILGLKISLNTTQCVQSVVKFCKQWTRGFKSQYAELTDINVQGIKEAVDKDKNISLEALNMFKKASTPKSFFGNLFDKLPSMSLNQMVVWLDRMQRKFTDPFYHTVAILADVAFSIISGFVPIFMNYILPAIAAAPMAAAIGGAVLTPFLACASYVMPELISRVPPDMFICLSKWLDGPTDNFGTIATSIAQNMLYQSVRVLIMAGVMSNYGTEVIENSQLTKSQLFKEKKNFFSRMFFYSAEQVYATSPSGLVFS